MLGKPEFADAIMLTFILLKFNLNQLLLIDNNCGVGRG